MIDTAINRFKILLVDSNPHNRGLFLDRLQEKTSDKMQLSFVGNLKDCLDKLKLHCFDLILLNLSLPDSNGYETFITVFHKAPQVPIIVITNQNDTELALKALNNGAQDYFLTEELHLYPFVRICSSAIERNKLLLSYNQNLDELKSVYEAMVDGLIIAEADTGKFIKANSKILSMLDYSENELLQLTVKDIHPPEHLEYIEDIFQKQIKQEVYINFNAPILRKDGTLFYADIASKPLVFNNKKCLMGLFRDVTDKKNFQEQQVFYTSLLEKLNQKHILADAIKDILEDIKSFFHFDAVGIRLKEGCDYPFYLRVGFSEEFILSENSLCQKDQHGNIIYNENNMPYLEGMCGNVLSGRIDPSLPFFTERGSFWTNNYKHFLSSTTEKDRQTKTRNRCYLEGYQSMALIVLKTHNESLGLLQIVDKKPDRLTCEMIKFFEDISVGIAIALKRNQLFEELDHHKTNLEQQIKERTTLLNSMNKIQQETFTEYAYEDVARVCLNEALEITNSAFGFILETNKHARADAITISYSGWEACNLPEEDALRLIRNMQIKGLWGAVIKNGEPIITNNPSSHPESTGTPEGHPVITSFLGIPLKFVGNTIGMIGIANKPGGYNEQDLYNISKMAGTCVEALNKKKSDIFVKEQNKRLKEKQVLLAAQNEELQAREEELAHQNEELQAREEELTLQNEELQAREEEVASQNEELQAREEELAHQNLELILTQSRIDSINKILIDAIKTETFEEVARVFIIEAQKLTNSQFGFLGNLNKNNNLDVFSHSLTSWEVCTVSDAKQLLQNMAIKGIWGKAILENRHCIVNDPASDPYRVGLPEGHPPLHNFMGVLIYQENKIWGLIGLANKPGGFVQQDIETIEILSHAFLDVYRSKQHEYELGRTNSILTTISNTALDGIIMINSNGNILHWNNAAERIFGYSFDEVSNKNLHELLTPPKDIQAYVEGIKQFKLTGKGNYIGKTIELKALKKDQSEIDVELSIASIKIAEEWNAVGIVRDITERKIIEEKINDTLQNLSETNLKLEDANKHKDRFLSHVSHELRTPLNAIIGFGQALEKQYFGQLNDKQLEYIKLITSSGEHLLSLINDLLDISKLDAGVLELGRQKISVNKLIMAILIVMENDIKQKSLTIQAHLNHQLPEIYSDERRCKQILINLLSNAVKYSPENENIEITSELTEENMIKICITDKGVGLSKDDQIRIFDEFYQTRYTQEKAIQGSGIGLSLTKKLIKTLGGTIGVISELNKGSTFWFILPVNEN